MNSKSNPITTQDRNTQDTHVLTCTANKAEMLKRIEQTYQLSNQVYERVGQIVDTVCDKREAFETFQGTDDFSTSQVDQIFQALSKALEVIDQELDWIPTTR